MRTLKAKISFLQDVMYSDTFISLLFLVSIFLFLYNIFCNIEVAANYLAGSATFMAAFLTLRVAKSADESSKKSLEMNQKIVDLEIMKEGPALYIMTKEYYPTGQEKQFKLKNLGGSPAVNIHCKLFTPVNDYPLNPDSSESEPKILICNPTDNNEYPKENTTEEYVIEYENLFGKKFSTIFTMSESNANEANTISPRRISVLKITGQKIKIVE